MVLAAQGQIVSESELRERCDCTFLGTEALNAVDAMRAMGFSNSSKCTLKITELIVKLNAGLYPIVFVNLLPIDGINDPHAIVVTAIDEDEVQVSDPLQGDRFDRSQYLYSATPKYKYWGRFSLLAKFMRKLELISLLLDVNRPDAIDSTAAVRKLHRLITLIQHSVPQHVSVRWLLPIQSVDRTF
jgi:hypothetical protein